MLQSMTLFFSKESIFTLSSYGGGPYSFWLPQNGKALTTVQAAGVPIPSTRLCVFSFPASLHDISQPRKQALYRLGRHGEAAEIYAQIAKEDEEGGESDASSFPAVAVNLAAAAVAAGDGEKALDYYPAEEVTRALDYMQCIPFVLFLLPSHFQLSDPVAISISISLSYPRVNLQSP